MAEVKEKKSISLASFSTRKKPTSKKKYTNRRKKIDGRWFQAGKHRGWDPQCFKCADFKPPASYRRDEEGNYEPFCRNCSRIINRKMEEIRKRNLPGPPELECENCGVKFTPKTKVENLVVAKFCSLCRSSKKIALLRRSPLDEAYTKLYPHLKDYGHKTLEEIKAAGLAGPTYFDLTREEREKALILAKEIIYKETNDERWINGHERSGSAQLSSQGTRKERKTA